METGALSFTGAFANMFLIVSWMLNDVSHVFTEILLNVMFPNFITLDPAWNCSGYGNPKFFNILNL